MALEISDALLDTIRRHGAETYPHECCGALLGVAGPDGTKQVRALLPWYSYVVVRVAAGQPQEATSWVLAHDRRASLSELLPPPAASNRTEGA